VGLFSAVDDIKRFEGGFLLTNAYLVPTPGGGQVMIDAPADADQWIEELGIVPLALLLTHQHFDHVLSASKIAALGVPVYAWSDFDRGLLLEETVREWGMPFNVDTFPVNHVLKDRATLEIDGISFSLRHLPGHSPDSVVFHQAEAGVLFAGDTLFAGSTGRADLPGGDPEALYQGIREQIYTLDPDVRVLPGHGPETQVGVEARSNPVVRAS
jgi:glyoxylase-like metal-dependent hydrolase (beta-lactamase superfamily II)